MRMTPFSTRAMRRCARTESSAHERCLWPSGLIGKDAAKCSAWRWPTGRARRAGEKKRSGPGTGAVSVNSLSITDRSWKPRVAVCLLIMGCQRLRAGGGRRVGAAWASFCQPGYSLTLSSIGRCSRPSDLSKGTHTSKSLHNRPLERGACSCAQVSRSDQARCSRLNRVHVPLHADE
jgi:hypothetical protein